MAPDPYRAKPVLVTGGAGVIGRELIGRLVGAGARVLCSDLAPRPPEFGPEVAYLRADANHLTRESVAAFRPELCFHLAATFERSVESPAFWDESFRHNVRLSHHLMSVLAGAPALRRVVFASSYLVYDPALYSFDAPPAAPVRLDESARISPRNICGAAKLLHEIELRFLTGFPSATYTSVCARIFRVYGRGSRDVVSRWVRALVADPRASLSLYRKEGIFDYVHAGDVAEGLLRLGACGAQGAVNLGSGRGRSVAELVEVLRGHFPGLRTEEVDAAIPWEAQEADLGRLARETGWRPQVTLEAGIPELIEHERRARAAEPAGPARPARELNVLITSASRKVDLVQRYRAALDELGLRGAVWAADMDGECVAGAFADAVWEQPPLGALSSEELLAFCKENRIGLLVPTRDGELEWLAERAQALAEAGVWLPLGPAPDVRDCRDKLRFWERCRVAGIPAIPTFVELDALLQAGAAERIVVKERFGAGSRTIGVGLDAAQARQHAARLRAPVFQPLVEGVEHSIDLYAARDGTVIDVVPRVRRQVLAGESVVSETLEAPALVEGALAAAREFRLRGHAVLQAFATPGGVRFIECNPRYGGASALAMQAGLHSPRWSLLEALGERVEPQRGAYRRGLRMLRYAADRFVERHG